jgi:hypothetical protein
MRLRRVSVIAALSLLVWTATASAECAWVLWRQLLDPSRNLHWEVVDAYATRATCQQALAPEELRRQSELEAQKKEGNPPLLVPIRSTCLPDTVDPRGPKAR